MNRVQQANLFAVVLSACIAAAHPAYASDEAVIPTCVPEGSIETPQGVSMPAELPKNIPLPEKLTLMSSSSMMPDEYNPYQSITVEFAAEGSREAVFAFYEKAFPAAGYRIVMWEKEPNMGMRYRGDGIEEGMLSIAEYDCRPLINITLSFLPSE